MLYPVKNEPVKSYGIVQTTQWFVLIGERRKHIKRTETTERKNTLPVCFVAQPTEELSTKRNTGN